METNLILSSMSDRPFSKEILTTLRSIAKMGLGIGQGSSISSMGFPLLVGTCATIG